jgi:hypothetical protein
VESRSKASAGSVAGGIVGALLAIAAIFAVFFIVRRNRKKSAEEGAFNQSYFRKRSEKLDDVTLDGPFPPHPAVAIKRGGNVVRSPYTSGDFGELFSVESYQRTLIACDQPEAGKEQQYSSYYSSSDDNHTSPHPSTPILPGENPFIVPREDALAAKV